MTKTREPVLELLRYYDARQRPLTLLEIQRLTGGAMECSRILIALEEYRANDEVRVENGFYFLNNSKGTSMSRRMQDGMADQKWKTLARAARYFRWVPWIDFVVVTGSMAVGNVRTESDFDVLVGVRAGRMFTTRYIINAVFTLVGKRRMRDTHEGNGNVFCFNHFVTSSIPSSSVCDNDGEQIYRNAVPLYGSADAIRKFGALNVWAESWEQRLLDRRFLEQKPHLLTRTLELFLSGAFGDWVEQSIARPIAVRRLTRYIRSKLRHDHVVFSDTELEFHFNTTIKRQ